MSNELTTEDGGTESPHSPPEMIGPYRILGVLGEGGMGVVYEAGETGPVRRRVALKIVRAGLSSREVLARFALERQALALMNHQGIAKVFHAGATDAGEPYFAMELVRGLPITEYCDSQRLTVRQRLALFIAVCNAVQHAHQKGVIHRDLKPSNILVTEQDGAAQPKVIDFGIAKALSHQLTDSTMVTHAGVPLGTAAYMSPEQAESSGLDVDTRTDIYSLGVILFELLVGELPMTPGESLHLFIARLASGHSAVPLPSDLFTTLGTGRELIASARNTDAHSLRRALRGDLDWIVIKALDVDRARRYDSATALANDIARHLVDQPVTARSPSTGYRVRKFILRHRIAVPASALALTAIAASASFAVAGLVRATRAEQLARQEADAARSVTDFLVELFKAPAPGELRGDQLTARQLLERGAQRASIDLRNQPLLQGRITHTVGTAYTALGLYDEARVQLEAALAARVRTHGATSLPVAETELALGDAAAGHGEFNSADGHYLRALAIRDALLGHEHPLVARVAYALGSLRYRQGRFDEAETQYARALAVDQREDAGSAEVAHDLMGLGFVLWKRDRFAQAEALIKKSIAVSVARLGPEHTDVVSSLNNLGVIYWSMHRYSDALPLYEQVRATFERTLDPSHPKLAVMYTNLGELYWKLNRYAEAEPLFRRALAIKEARYTADNPSVAITLHSMASLLRDEGKLPEAESAYRRALAIRTRALGPAHGDVVETRTALAGLLRSTGRVREADSLMAQAAPRR